MNRCINNINKQQMCGKTVLFGFVLLIEYEVGNFVQIKAL
ncbi:hypothetical protein HMPREF1987_01640 [Peptostreptococcaceae bacterium oral taxon 113 str. W5053]|nr:hypothetical protein HMPREF1987_01640 [Peptostreptococcaceae bacterium oral taxon 113 str. W5053]